MENTINISKFDAANIKAYADNINYNNLISALSLMVAIYDENHLGVGKGEIDTEDFNHALCSIIRYCDSVEVLRQEVTYALKDKDLAPYIS